MSLFFCVDYFKPCSISTPSSSSSATTTATPLVDQRLLSANHGQENSFNYGYNTNTANNLLTLPYQALGDNSFYGALPGTTDQQQSSANHSMQPPPQDPGAIDLSDLPGMDALENFYAVMQQANRLQGKLCFYSLFFSLSYIFTIFL